MRVPTVPCRERPVIIASATRSGSTLLQRLLNTHPDVTIWGEHMGILTELRRAMAVAASSARNLSGGYAQRSNLIGKLVDAEPFSPHINPFDADVLRTAVHDFIVRLFAEALPEDTIWGFKEVRYFADDLEFFAALFPSARFIVLAREPSEQISSYLRAPWRKKPDLSEAGGIEQLRQTVAKAAVGWTRQYESFRQFVVRHTESSMVVTFDQLANLGAVANVFAHIGLPPPDDGSTANVLGRRTGSSDKTTTWRPDDREMLDAIITSTVWPSDHNELLSFFFGDRSDGAD